MHEEQSGKGQEGTWGSVSYDAASKWKAQHKAKTNKIKMKRNQKWERKEKYRCHRKGKYLFIQPISFEHTAKTRHFDSSVYTYLCTEDCESNPFPSTKCIGLVLVSLFLNSSFCLGQMFWHKISMH